MSLIAFRSFSALGILLLCGLNGASAWAQDALPKRKPGLWQVAMQMQGAPGPMSTTQCVDAKSDEELQRRGFSDANAQCKPPTVKRSGGVIDVQTDCTAREGQSQISARFTGDMQTSYKVDGRISFNPPRAGLREASMQMDAKYLGACPAGMAPGELRMAGTPATPGGMPAGMDPARLQNMSPEELNRLVDKLKNLPPPPRKP